MALELKLHMTFGSGMLSASEGMSFLKKIVDFLPNDVLEVECGSGVKAAYDFWKSNVFGE